MQDLRTLEMGCGAGLCSIVAAIGGASVVATDGVSDATDLVAQSAALNRVDLATRTGELKLARNEEARVEKEKELAAELPVKEVHDGGAILFEVLSPCLRPVRARRLAVPPPS